MNDSGAFIMECFNPQTLPIMNTLAEEFAVIDHWFAAVPGPTEPNRIFSMMGTSQGIILIFLLCIHACNLGINYIHRNGRELCTKIG